MVKALFNVAEFTKLMLYNCIKVVRLTPDQPNQWLWACIIMKSIKYVHRCKISLMTKITNNLNCTNCLIGCHTKGSFLNRKSVRQRNTLH